MDLKMAKDVMFYNSDYIVVEYMDMIKAPYLILLEKMRRLKGSIRQILDLDQVASLSEDALKEWYIMRKNRNFLIDLCKYPGKIGKSYLDKLLSTHINSDYRFYEYANVLPVGAMLFKAKAHGLVKGIIVFSEEDDKGYIKKDVESTFKDIDVNYFNNFDEAIELAGANSTYFLSDIKKISRMKEKDVLKYSSVTIASEYRYNKKDVDHYDINYDDYWKTDPFKLSFVRAITKVIN